MAAERVYVLGEVYTRTTLMNYDITITKVNEAFVRIQCEPGILHELAEFFTFYADDYKFSPMYKRKVWDGKIRLLNKKNMQLPHGLAFYICKIARDKGYTCLNTTNKETNFTLKDAEFFANSLKLPMEPRDYQLAAFATAIRSNRRLILSPTASGKSLVAYLLARFLLQFECKQGILIVPTVSLVEQMYGDFEQYGWNAEKYCQRVYAGFDKNISKPLVISTWQSLQDFPTKYFAPFDFIIGDEAHTFKAKSLSYIMNNMHNARFRIGMTGTVKDTQVNLLSIEGHFGPTYRAISTKELMDRGQIAQLQIKCLVLSHPEHAKKNAFNMDYQQEVDFIVSNTARNEYVRDLALSMEKNTLVLFNYVEKHGQIIHDLIAEKAQGRKVFFVHGGVDAEDRETIRHLTEKENDAIIVASLGTFSTGVNIKNLHNVIFAHIGKSKIKILQSIGRGLRLSENKTNAVIYDLVDDLRHKDRINFSMKHYVERVKIYNEEKFKISNSKVELKYE
jgi:superfamily II DNA or RNA helicase